MSVVDELMERITGPSRRLVEELYARIAALEKDLAFQAHAAASWRKEAEDFEAERDALRKERDDAVAALAVVKNPAPFPSDRFVASMLSLLPEYFNDADLNVAWDAMSKALKHAAEVETMMREYCPEWFDTAGGGK